MDNVSFWKKQHVIIWMVLALGLVARLCEINKFDLWFDELVSNMYCARNIERLAAAQGISAGKVFCSGMEQDPHSPAYYLIVYAYSLVFGMAKSLRMISVFFGILSLLLIYRLARFFADRSTSVWAVLIMALNPFHIWYAQEARGYTMACFFALLLIYFFLAALKKDKPCHWIGFSVSAAIGLLVLYHMIFLILCTGIVLCFKKFRGKIGQWALAMILPAIIFLPMSGLLFKQADFVKESFWLQPPTWRTMRDTFIVFNFGYSADVRQQVIGGALASGLLLWGVKSFFKEKKESAVILLLFFIFPVALTYLYSKTQLPIYLDRRLIIVSPFLYIVMARGLTGIKRKVVRVAAGLLLMTVLSSVLVNYYRGFMLQNSKGMDYYVGVHQKKNYSPLMRALRSQVEKGDILAATDIQSLTIFFAYFRRMSDVSSFPGAEAFQVYFYPQLLPAFQRNCFRMDELQRGAPLDDSRPYLMEFSPERQLRPLRFDENSPRRVWLISSSWDRDDRRGENALRIRELIKENYVQLSTRQEEGITLDLFVRRDRLREAGLSGVAQEH